MFNYFPFLGKEFFVNPYTKEFKRTSQNTVAQNKEWIKSNKRILRTVRFGPPKKKKEIINAHREGREVRRFFVRPERDPNNPNYL